MREVAGALQVIVACAANVGHRIAGIAASAQAQRAQLEGSRQAVGEMDRVIQQDAASAEQASAAASELSAQAEELASMVSGFKLAEGKASRMKPARPALAGRAGPPA